MSGYNNDNPVLAAMMRLGDVVLISVLFTLCSLPVITVGAASAAAWHDMMKIVTDRQSYTVKGFFQYFAENFKQATLLWLIMLGAGIVIGCDIYFAIIDASSPLANLLYFFIAAAVLYLFTLLYVFPLQATFSNSKALTIKNAAALAIRHFGYTLVLAAIWLLPAVLVVFVQNIVYYMISFMLFFGFGAQFYVSSFIFNHIFANYIEAR